jgi:hypothetical protein
MLETQEEIMVSLPATREAYFPKTGKDEASPSGVSWPAVWAGSFAAGSISIILMALGAGVGLSALSPWPSANNSFSRVGFGAIAWLIVVQIVASALGGYLAGRLRTKWVDLHTHEVYFRDTAHGFLVWAVSLVISSLFFVTYAAAMTSAGRGTLSNGAHANGANNYFVDFLFRTDRPADAANDQAARAEAETVLGHALLQPDIPALDRSYLTQLVAANTGLNQEEVDRRVSETVTAARQAADTARKAVAHSLYWLFVAFLIGAFCASYAATIGGRQRDRIPA